jgi:hypothetical protein
MWSCWWPRQDERPLHYCILNVMFVHVNYCILYMIFVSVHHCIRKVMFLLVYYLVLCLCPSLYYKFDICPCSLLYSKYEVFQSPLLYSKCNVCPCLCLSIQTQYSNHDVCLCVLFAMFVHVTILFSIWLLSICTTVHIWLWYMSIFRLCDFIHFAIGQVHSFHTNCIMSKFCFTITCPG